jgi:hypothetical protein
MSYGNGDGRVEPSELRRLLIDVAKRGELITYGAVAAAFNERWHQGFGSSLKKALNMLGYENKAAGEPLLMALVVNKDTRQPGSGFYEEIGEPGADFLRRTELLELEANRCRDWTW